MCDNQAFPNFPVPINFSYFIDVFLFKLTFLNKRFQRLKTLLNYALTQRLMETEQKKSWLFSRIEQTFSKVNGHPNKTINLLSTHFNAL